MTTRTRVAYTFEELAVGVPYWGPNTVTTDLVPGQTDISIENLVAGKRYYIKSWTEDEFGQKSPELLRNFNTAPPKRLTPLTFSANGYLDSGSPMRAYVKVPTIKSVASALVTLAFRQFMAPATAATSGSGTLTSVSGGGATSGSGGSSTPTSSASSSSTSANEGAHTHLIGGGFILGSIAGGVAAKAVFPLNGGGSTSIQVTTDAAGAFTPVTAGGTNHQHNIAHTHDVTIAGHTHTTPAHTHDVPTHTHALVYGTFEETYPVSHSVKVMTYQRSNTGLWVLKDTSASLTGDLVDLDLTAVITSAGDWRLEVLSDAAQPNGGRLGLDLFGTLTVTI